MIIKVNGILGYILFKLCLKTNLNTFGDLRNRNKLKNDKYMYKDKNNFESDFIDKIN